MVVLSSIFGEVSNGGKSHRFSQCIFRRVYDVVLRALKSLLGKPCVKLEKGESNRSVRCGLFFLAGAGKNQAHHDSWDLLREAEAIAVLAEWEMHSEHATWVRIFQRECLWDGHFRCEWGLLCFESQIFTQQRLIIFIFKHPVSQSARV